MGIGEENIVEGNSTPKSTSPSWATRLNPNQALSSLGLACYIAWSFVFWNGSVLFGDKYQLISFNDLYLAQGAFSALAALLLVLSVRKVGSLERRTILLVAFALISSIAIVFAALAGYQEAPPEFFFVGFALSGIGSCLRLGWEEHLSIKGVKSAAIGIGLAYLLGFLMFSFVSLLPSFVALVTTVLLPIFSCVLLVHANKKGVEAALPEGTPKPVSGESLHTLMRRIPWKLLVAIALAYFSYGATRMDGVSGGLTASNEISILVAGSPALACLFGICLAYYFYRHNAVVAFYVAFPLMAAAALIPTAIDPFHGGTAFWVTLVGAELVKYLVWFLLIDGIMKDGASALLCLALMRFAQWAGSCFGQIFVDSVPSHEAVIIGILFSLIFALLIIIGSPFVKKGGKETPLSEEGLLEQRIQRAVEKFNLSPREKEVLSIWATGRSGAYIEKKLFISKSTVKSHLNHIYAKTGTSNREELLELLDTFG